MSNAEQIIAKLRPGDIILVTEKKFKWFRKLLTRLTKNEVRFTHCQVVIGVDPPILMEAEERIVKRDITRFVNVLEREEKSYKIVRKNRLWDMENDLIWSLESQLGDFYGIGVIALHAIGILLGSKKIASRFNRNPRVVCSSFVAKGFQDTFGVRFNGMDWWAVTPDDIDDETSKPDWIVVAEKTDNL